MPGGESDDRVSFADEQTDHPLGRLIKLDYDSAMASAYRIKDDVIREVNRQMDGGRFTISVFEVNRNAEGKYLPGLLHRQLLEQGRLAAVRARGARDVGPRGAVRPARHARRGRPPGKDEHRNLSMKFSNHKLLK